MTPIISPWWFYLFDIVAVIDGVTLAILLILGGIMITILFACVICGENFPKCWKPMLITFIITLFFNLFIPSKETCLQMAVASLVTPDNIAAVSDTTTNIVDYIVDSVDKLLEDNEEGEVE